MCEGFCLVISKSNNEVSDRRYNDPGCHARPECEQTSLHHDDMSWQKLTSEQQVDMRAGRDTLLV